MRQISIPRIAMYIAHFWCKIKDYWIVNQSTTISLKSLLQM